MTWTKLGIYGVIGVMDTSMNSFNISSLSPDTEYVLRTKYFLTCLWPSPLIQSKLIY